MKYEIIMTSAFKKQLKIIKKRKVNIERLSEIVNKLANDEKLDIKYRDHALNNDFKYQGCRECHITPDWLLIYKKSKKDLILYLIETGSHSDLF